MEGGEPTVTGICLRSPPIPHFDVLVDADTELGKQLRHAFHVDLTRGEERDLANLEGNVLSRAKTSEAELREVMQETSGNDDFKSQIAEQAALLKVQYAIKHYRETLYNALHDTLVHKS